MYIPRSNLKQSINILLLFITLFYNVLTWALSTDSDQPIEIEADAGELDDQKGITIYTGDVVVTQGSIRMTGQKMTVYYNKNKDLETVIMEGQPATYRQLPDNSQVYDEAEALRMEYYETKNLIVLIDQAVVKQEGLRFSGSRIDYDTLNSKIKAKGETKQNGETTQGSGRVKITIKPKNKEKSEKTE